MRLTKCICRENRLGIDKSPPDIFDDISGLS
jgi:hypothetical protein